MLLCFVLVLLMLVCAPVTRAQTQETAEQTLEQALVESCTYNRKIDISRFDITLDAFKTLFYEMIDRGDLPWYTMRETFYYELAESSEKLLSFQPRLLPDYQYNRALYQQRLEEILRECVVEGMADWQIALSIHDYLIVHGYYDESINERTGYDLLTNGKTVCTGYTEVYRELLNMVGIPCVYAASEEMRHIWNLVQIGGQWYHVDVTWDDPTPDCYGRVCHDYFLLTDAQIAAGEDPHHGWQTEIQCTDTTFDDAFWKGIENPILFTDSDTCYLIRDKKYSNVLYKRTLSTGKETVVYKEKSEYLNIGKGSYRYLHHGLSLWNGRLWVGTMSKVLSMDLDGNNVRTEFTYAAKKNKRYIAGFYVDKDYIAYLTREHTGYTASYIETLKPTGYHIHRYTQTVVEPTCGVHGYTLSECACGIRCQSSFVYKLEHEFVDAQTIAPTVWKEGLATQRCTHCGEEHSQVLPKLAVADYLAGSNIVVGTVAGGIVGMIVALILTISKRGRKGRKKPDSEMQEQSQTQQTEQTTSNT
jgi:hypothetical protein